MEIEIFTISEYAADYGNGKLSILGTFDTIFCQSFPSIHPSCSLALRIRIANSEAGEHTFEIRSISSLIQPFTGNLKVRKNPNADHSTFNIVLNLNNLNFNKPGKHSFEFLFNGEFRSGLNLYVVKHHQKISSPNNN